MKYFNVQGINKATQLIREGNNTNEHVTSRATFAMINNYFKQENNFFPTPEQIQVITNKRPDYVIEKFITVTPYFKPHAFVEVKSLINSNIGEILDQLYNTVLYTMDLNGGTFSCFMVAMKGTKIAFYTYHNFAGLLDEWSIPNYKGFILLNYIIPYNLYKEINSGASLQMYQDYVISRASFETNSSTLQASGAIKTGRLEHPHIMDLVNNIHKEDIHSMWKHIVEHSSDLFLD